MGVALQAARWFLLDLLGSIRWFPRRPLVVQVSSVIWQVAPQVGSSGGGGSDVRQGVWSSGGFLPLANWPRNLLAGRRLRVSTVLLFLTFGFS